MTRLIDYMMHYMQDGQPRRLIHIAHAVKAMGWEAGLSNQYMGIYTTIRNNPHIFQRVGPRSYKMIADFNSKLDKDLDQIRESIFDMLQKKPKQTATQIWRQLMADGITITYTTAQYLLQADMFTKDDFSRYSNL